MATMDADLLAAIESGALTQNELIRFITYEAAEMGLSYQQALDRHKAGTLPKTARGSDVDLLFRMLTPR